MKRTLAILATIVVASASNAQVFFNNINGSWESSAWTLQGTGFSNPQMTAARFTSTGTGIATDVTVAIRKQPGTGGSGTLSFMTDSGSDTLGTTLQTVAFTGVQDWTDPTPFTVSGFNVPVTAGSKYWLLVNPDAAFNGGWYVPLGATADLVAYKQGASPFNYQISTAGIKVEGVPEPMSVTALAIGAAGLLRRRMRAKA
ncbi:MAG: hypothetical protein KIS66_07540 [Fimbriimonadaceae bacterium]|nr:hypothetical protein [Fimbriimonadaceae bacterium]